MRILSGVFEGRTTGTAIGLMVDNVDARGARLREDQGPVPSGPRRLRLPAEVRDSATTAAAGAPRRASRSRPSRPARSRASGCANGSASRVAGWLSQVGPHRLDCVDAGAARGNPFFCADPDKLPVLESYIRELRRDGDSVGARVSVRASRGAAGPRRADVRPARCRHRLRDDGHQCGQGRRDRRRRRGRRPARHGASRRAHAGRFRVEPRRRHARRHQFRPGPDRARLVQADFEHPDAGPDHRHGRRSRPRSRPPGATIPAWGCVRCRSSRRCCCWCSWTMRCGTAPNARTSCAGTRSSRAECRRINALRHRGPSLREPAIA